jgi:hypothetical protein
MPTVLAAQLSAETVRWWWVALALGAVVALVLVVLLQLLLNRVREVEQGAARVWHHGKLVARNTATAWMIGQTADSLDRLEEEAGRHAQLLGDGQVGGPR